MQLSDADVLEIIRLLDASGYNELEIETESFRLVLQRSPDKKGWSRQRETLARPRRADPPNGNDAPASGEAAKRGPASLAQAGNQTAPHAAAEANDGLSEILSPIVGTFYRAPRPGSDPFVQPGSRVQPDTVVAIIEVMKLMNSVSAGLDGEVVEVVVEDGQLIEKGQCLMRVRPQNSSRNSPLNPMDGQAT